jgi:hypothetical protein
LALWECALSFMRSQVLLTAEELGVFESMASCPRRIAEIGAATGLPEDSADRLLAARGRERSASEYGAWSHACGFTLQQVYRASKGKCFLIARRA